MSRVKSLAVSILFLLPLTGSAHRNMSDTPASSRDIMTSMLNSIDKIRTLKYTFKSYERLNGKSEDFFTEMDIKVNLSPRKMYGLTKSKPNEGVEVLYVEGQWNNKAKVNAGKWLPNLNLNPYGGRMRENQHHTIMEAGFGFLASIIKNAIKRADTEKPGEFDSFFRYDGDITWQGRPCFKVTIDDPEFTYVNYTVKPSEDINKIEKDKGICGYLILTKNGLKDFDDVKPGMTVKIPTSYAKKTILYIDKSTYLPIVQIMYDDIGQFEKYEFHSLSVNPAFKDVEFTTDFDGYRF